MGATQDKRIAAGLLDLEIHTAQTGDGTWVAATRSTPFLYITAATYDDLLRRLRTCCEFYLSKQAAINSCLTAREAMMVQPNLENVGRFLLRDIMKVG